MKNLGRCRESNQGPQLRQLSTSKTFTIFPLYGQVVPIAAVSYSTDHQLCAVRTPFSGEEP